MNITKAGVERILLAITGHHDFGTSGHDGDRACDRDLVAKLGAWLKEAPSELYIPDAILSSLEHSVLGDIVAGYGRPLYYLCSDCRYPKWMMTADEFKKQFPTGRKDKTIRADGFVEISNGCPICGD